MLSEELYVVRSLVDLALENGESGPATKLSRLASSLEKAVSFLLSTAEEYVSRAEIDRSTVELVEAYCECAEALLDDDQYAVFDAALSGALPAAIVEDQYVAALEKEYGQVAALFASAVEAALVGDIVRLGSLLVVKAKALTRAQIRSGVLLSADDVRLMSQPIMDANAAARRAIGGETCDPIVDAMLLRFPAGGQSDGS